MDQITIVFRNQKYCLAKYLASAMGTFLFFFILFSLIFGPPGFHLTWTESGAVIHYGWLYEDPCLILLCILFAMLAAVVYQYLTLFILLRKYLKIAGVLLYDCDPEEFLRINEQGVEYGSQVARNRFQKIFLRCLQMGYIQSLLHFDRHEEARAYLGQIPSGRRNRKLIRIMERTINLNDAIQSRDAGQYEFIVKQLTPAQQKEPRCQAMKEYLYHRYENAISILTSYTPKYPFHEIESRLLLGQCYLKLGKINEARKNLEYVAEHGNKLPHRQKALDILESLEQENSDPAKEIPQI